MSTQPGPDEGATPLERFEWHPDYRGRTVREVTASIKNELASDQRAVALAMEGADRQESQVLATVVKLERKWGTFDLDWATADASELADRIAAFEQDRERRRELFPYNQYRQAAAAAEAAAAPARPWWRFW